MAAPATYSVKLISMSGITSFQVYIHPDTTISILSRLADMRYKAVTRGKGQAESRLCGMGVRILHVTDGMRDEGDNAFLDFNSDVRVSDVVKQESNMMMVFGTVEDHRTGASIQDYTAVLPPLSKKPRIDPDLVPSSPNIRVFSLGDGQEVPTKVTRETTVTELVDQILHLFLKPEESDNASTSGESINTASIQNITALLVFDCWQNRVFTLLPPYDKYGTVADVMSLRCSHIGFRFKRSEEAEAVLASFPKEFVRSTGWQVLHYLHFKMWLMLELKEFCATLMRRYLIYLSLLLDFFLLASINTFIKSQYYYLSIFLFALV
tara:strand:- start:529 stop:1494 length:966 start_codon:yes stop_codon:yes gene_type:complete